MNESSLREKGYMSSKEAGALLGYTHDYISRLCRQGKMSGIQKGREWFVTKSEIDAFKLRHEVELKEKKIELSKKFSRIRLEHEAKKRKAREQASSIVQTQTPIEPSPSLRTFHTDKKSVKFVLPRELIAVAVLALLVLAPSVFNVVAQTPVVYRDTNYSADQSTSVGFTKTLEQGIQDTILAQSTVVEPTASVFSFVPYLSEGYSQLFSVIGQLPKQTFDTWTNIGNGYLTIYVAQGELIYTSIQDLNTMGASVLQGYELLGESFVVGARNIIEVYSNIFTQDSQTESAKKKLTRFFYNVHEGGEYVKKNISSLFLNSIPEQIPFAYSVFIDNVGTNLYAMHTTYTGLSKYMSANTMSFFDTGLIFNKNQSNIRVIEIGQ